MALYRIIPSTGKFATFMRKHGTDIMTYGGLGLMTLSSVAACIGTKNMIAEEEDIKQEPAVAKRIVRRGKHYVLATVFWAGGVFSIHKSHGHLKAENAALGNTVASMMTGAMAYRERWKEKVGQEEEEKIFLDEKTEEIVDKDGKKKKVKTTSIDKSISTDIYFDRYCSWLADDSGDIDYDEKVAKGVAADLNNMLWGCPERHIFLNKAYDMYQAFTENEYGQHVAYQTVAGQRCGWILDKQNPTGDNTIVVKITRTHRKLPDGEIIPTLRLSFNHEGDITNAAKERGLLG